MPYNSDGEIHAISTLTAYIYLPIDKFFSKNDSEEIYMSAVYEVQTKLMRKYCEYFIDNAREKCIDILMKNFGKDLFNKEFFDLSILPNGNRGVSGDIPITGLRFNRFENDNLEDPFVW